MINFWFYFFENREERRDLNYGYHDPDPFAFLRPSRAYPKSATRREDVDSSEEDDDHKDSSESPSGNQLYKC